MRERSETIYAENEEEYKIILDVKDKKQSQRRKSQKKLDFDNDISDELDGFANYKLTEIQPTIKEKEQQDEGKLLETIEEMNKKYKHIPTYDSDSSEGSFDSHLIDTNDKTAMKTQVPVFEEKEENSSMISQSFFLETEQNNNNTKGENELFSLISNETNINSTRANTISFYEGGLSMSSLEVFINQNLINFDEIVKLIVIGEKAVGKSLFVQKLICADNFDIEKYTPTESLEIKKTFIKIKDKTVKVETWDTNMSVLNSALIKTYYKISNGYILIADYERIETLFFLEKHIEHIFNMSHYINNIYFIVNKKNDTLQEPSIDSQIKAIEDKFNLIAKVFDLANFNIGQNDFDKFLQTALMNKKSKNGISLLQSTPSPGHKISLSNPSRTLTKSPHSTKFLSTKINESAVHMNISKKRYSGLKKKLHEILSTLNIHEKSH